MDFTLNFDDDLPLFSDSYDFSLDLEPKISKDIKYHLLSDTLESQKSSPINPRKDLFITKKIKTSFITIKTDISPKTKNFRQKSNFSRKIFGSIKIYSYLCNVKHKQYV